MSFIAFFNFSKRSCFIRISTLVILFSSGISDVLIIAGTEFSILSEPTDTTSSYVISGIPAVPSSNPAYALVSPCSHISRPFISSSSVALSPIVALITKNTIVIHTAAHAATDRKPNN